MGSGVYFFLWPLVSGSHLFELFTCEVQDCSFPGDVFRNVSRIQRSSWFTSGYVFGISLEASGRISHFST